MVYAGWLLAVAVLINAPGRPVAGAPRHAPTLSQETVALQEAGDVPASANPEIAGNEGTQTEPTGEAAVSSKTTFSDAELPPDALTTIDKYTGNNGVGVYAGLGTGFGFSYRRYIVDKLALRGTGAVFHVKDKRTLYSLGLTSQFDFMRDERFVLYALAGLAKDVSRAYSDGGMEESTWFFPTAGVGIELGVHDRIGFTYQFELSLTTIFVDGAYKLLLPLPNVGVYYTF